MKNIGINTGFVSTFFILLATLASAGIRGQASQGDPPGERMFTVVLDAGHGGHDPGNLGNGFLEKNIALSIVLEAGEALEKDPNVRVLYTRDDDTFVNLYKRGEIANKAKADLFVSVHCDSHSSNAHGAGTFVLGLHANEQNFEVAKKENSVIYLEDNYESRYADYDINSPESVIGLTIMQEEFLDQSILLGKFMQERFTANLKRKDRKVKQAGFIVLHQTFMPSVLIETGFLTNRDEGKYLNSGKGQQEMGRAIADAILEYRNSIRPNSTIQAGAQPPAVQAATGQQEPPVKEPVGAADAEEAASKTTSDSMPTSDKVADSPNGSGALIAPVVPAGQANTKVAETKENAEDGAKQVSEGLPGDPEKTTDIDTTPVSGQAESDVIFKVQLMAISKDVALTPDNFNGLNTLSKEQVNTVYRILYGNTSSYDQAEILKAGAHQKGYKQAFIVAYNKGERIPVEKALQLLSN